MISTSIKQLLAWPIAFALSGGFLIGCFEAFKYLPSHAFNDHQSNSPPNSDSDSVHQTEHATASDTEKSSSEHQTNSKSTLNEHHVESHPHSEAGTTEHTAKPAHTKSEKSHGIKTH